MAYVLSNSIYHLQSALHDAQDMDITYVRNPIKFLLNATPPDADMVSMRNRKVELGKCCQTLPSCHTLHGPYLLSGTEG